MTSNTSSPTHLLLAAVHMWGHARSMTVLAARIVKMRPVVVTFCIATKLYDRAKAEILSDFADDDEELLGRIRLIPIEQGPNLLDPGTYRDNFLAVWNELYSGKPIICKSVAGTEQVVDLRRDPLSILLVDGFAIEILNALYRQRETSPYRGGFNIWNWCPVSTTYIASHYLQDPIPLAEAIAERERMSFGDAAYQAMPRNVLLRPPGLPPMYDYEFQPQAFEFPRDMIGRIFIKLARGMAEADGIVTLDSEAFHPEATHAAREHYKSISRKFYSAGPLITEGRPGLVTQAVEGGNDVLKFMNEQLAVHGERSLIYISFGSLFWPPDSAKLSTTLETFMDKGIPFIFPRASPLAQLPEDLMQRLTEYPGVYMSDWVPQQAILDHPVTGWCLTHGGHNTIVECIHSGVPMIVWPIIADQPGNAVHISENLNIAYELLEVRTGNGLGQIYRTGQTPVGTTKAVREELQDVLARAFGEDGTAKRARIQELRKTMSDAWSDQGASRRDVEALLDDVSKLTPLTPAKRS
ncbi:UDP-Glycosyltransferase/glycogen phosphorylase [Cubamyces sp. BRFM 1775]|nr:UDP-Glycosyltransferase/glycogen phosphorylase [Cubamyces sp. BRFM 1775]